MATKVPHNMDAFYNLKIIEYANGQVEVRKYSDVIGGHNLYLDVSQDRYKELHSGRIALAKEKSLRERQGELLYNPFTGEEERLQSMFQIELEQKRAEKNLRDSLNRSKNAIYKYSRQADWKYFLTLTFSSECVDRSDYRDCMKKARRWFDNQRCRYAPNLKYLFVGELHSDGVNWHVHGLIDNVGDMKFVDSGKKDAAGRMIFNVGSWQFGWSTAIAIEQTQESIFKVSNYICKYITKDMCVRLKGQKRYYRSNNLDEPLEHTFLVDGDNLDNYIDMVADSLGASLTYQKNVSGYIDINYRFYTKERKVE